MSGNVEQHDDLKGKFDKVPLRPELMSITAINPFANHNSASRSLMLSSHLSQAVTLKYGDERIIQSGIERELAKQTFSKELKNDSRVIAVIPRYRTGVGIGNVNHIVDAVLIYHDLKLDELSYIDLPSNSKLHNYFGFKYDWNHDVIDNLKHNDIIKANTTLASSPAVSTNNGYKFGVNLNVCMMTMNETAEDGVIISESAAKRLGIDLYETRTVEFGTDSFLLNMYGDENNFKPFPEIGEKVHKSGAICATREYDDDLAPSLMSAKDMMEFDPIFDKVTYGRDGEGIITDIKVYHTPKSKKEVLSNTDALVNKYHRALIQYYQDILDSYNKAEAEYKKRYRGSKMKVSPKLTRLLVDAMALTDSANEKSDKHLKKLYRNDPMDIYRIEFVIKYPIQKAGVNFKVTDLSGAKSIIIDVRPDDEMPYELSTGVRADLVSDPASTISRMNIGRLYEAYIGKASRTVKAMITDAILDIDSSDDLSSTIDSLSSDIVDSLFHTVLEFLAIIDTEQYTAYNNLKNSKDKRMILKEIVTAELYIYYSIGSKEAYKIVDDINNSKFKPKIGKVSFKDNGKTIVSKDDIMIAPLYIMLLAKIADTWLSTASAKVNHFGLPTSTSKAEKHRLPWRNSATKVLSETESRLYGSYVGEEFLAELKDRGSSIVAHEEMYMNILTAEEPTNIERVIDREKVPYGQDKALEIVNSLYNCAGVEIAHKDDTNLHHVE